MQAQKQANKEHESIRLFENELLERLSHVHPIIPLLLWSPVAAWLLWRGVALYDIPVATVLALIVAAIFTWTITEYTLHRFMFHFPAKSDLGKRFVFLFHGNHHEDPKDKTRLVFPPAGSIPIMVGLYLLFGLVVPQSKQINTKRTETPPKQNSQTHIQTHTYTGIHTHRYTTNQSCTNKQEQKQ